jgi:hypothetical protein
MKHYSIKVTHLHDTAKAGQVRYNYCPTNKMPADTLTKPLGCVKFLKH